MDFISPELSNYVDKHTRPETELLARLNRETHAKVLMPRMLSGHLQGRVLSMLSHMIKPKKILEIGTYTGYSALCMAEGLVPGGILHTIDINEELTGMVQRYINEAQFEDRIKLHVGDAMHIIPTIQGPFNLVFIDADKINYSHYYDMVFDQVETGGFIIADNVLWSGKILQDYSTVDKDTRALMDFNKKVQQDPRVENVLFPIRDGLMVIRKK